MCSATPRRSLALSSATGGGWDVQCHTRKMREDKEWHIAEEMRNAPAWFGINYSNYREKTSPNDLWRCMVAITFCTTLCFVCISLFIAGRNDWKITRMFETEGYLL
jgi:hypothetical protein